MTQRARPSPRPRTLLALLLLASLAVPATVGAAGPETLPPLDDQLIVRYAPEASADARRAARERHGLERLASSRSGRSELVRARGRTVAEVRSSVAGDEAVRAIAPNHRREPAVDPMSEPRIGELWGLHNEGQTVRGVTGTADMDIDWPEATTLSLGDPAVVVAVIDTGIDVAHPDLAGAMWTNPGEAGAKAANGVDDDGNGYIDDVHGWDFCNDDASVHDAGEDQHGTHVAGTIAARLDGQGIVGVAPMVRLMSLKFIDGGPYCGTDWQAVQAIDYAASFGVPIINASWGGPMPSVVIEAAIRDSAALFVAAAGNQGVDIDAAGGPRFYPASSDLDTILAVGAMDQHGQRASFSNFGKTSVDLAAPGVRILSTQPAASGCAAPCYGWSSGTSMAVPHVSGVAALVTSRSSKLRIDPLGLRRWLLERGRGIPSGTSWLRTGRAVNAVRALDTTGPVAGPPDRFTVARGTRVATDLPLTVAWPPAKDASTGVRAYQLRRSGPDGTKRVGSPIPGTTATATITLREAYRFRVAAIDGAGNLGPEASGPSIVAMHHNEATSLARYSAGWRRVGVSSALGGRVMTTSSAGASTRFRFTGRSVALVATRGPGRGAVRVYVDGVYERTVDLERSTRLSRRVVFTQGWTGSATHEIRLVTVDRGRVDIDAWVVVR